MIDVTRVADLTRQLLDALGQDTSREGLRDTPERVARWYQEFLDYNPGTLATSFESIRVDQMVVVSGMHVWSLCEHHLLPFWCDVSIGYLTNGHVLGLSKFARIAQYHAHALQLQERLVDQIATSVSEYAQTPSVAVIARGQHLCMAMRGIKAEALMTCSAMRGVFYDDATTRHEFLSLAEVPHAGPGV